MCTLCEPAAVKPTGAPRRLKRAAYTVLAMPTQHTQKDRCLQIIYYHNMSKYTTPDVAVYLRLEKMNGMKYNIYNYADKMYMNRIRASFSSTTPTVKRYKRYRRGEWLEAV